jgi:hypothetical protein
LRGEGEIASIYETEDVEALEDVSAHAVARSQVNSQDTDDAADAKAVITLIRAMRVKNPGLSAEDLHDKAENTYARLCQAFSEGKMDRQAFTGFAALLGENPDALRDRLQRD